MKQSNLLCHFLTLEFKVRRPYQVILNAMLGCIPLLHRHVVLPQSHCIRLAIGRLSLPELPKHLSPSSHLVSPCTKGCLVLFVSCSSILWPVQLSFKISKQLTCSSDGKRLSNLDITRWILFVMPLTTNDLLGGFLASFSILSSDAEERILYAYTTWQSSFRRVQLLHLNSVTPSQYRNVRERHVAMSLDYTKRYA
jgi:hypothetical protein